MWKFWNNLPEIYLLEYDRNTEFYLRNIATPSDTLNYRNANSTDRSWFDKIIL